MKREEKQKLKAKEIQEKILNETYKENFSHGEADFIIQPDAATMMKGTLSLVQDEIFENLQEVFQKEYKKQIDKLKKKEKIQLSFWDKQMPPIRVKFSDLDVRPDNYDEVQLAAIAMGEQRVEIPGVNESGDMVMNYMPIFTKVSVPVTTFEEVNRSEGAKKTPYKKKERRKGYIEFTINPEVGHEYFEVKQRYTKYMKGVAKKCTCKYSPKMYRYAAHWRDMGGTWEFDYISFRWLLGLRGVVPAKDESGKPVYEEVDLVYPDFGEVKRFVLEKTQKDVKRVADKNEFDCYFTYDIVMPKKANGERMTRGNPEKIVFHVHLSELGKHWKSFNNIQQMNIRLEYMMMKELHMSKQSATSLTSRITEEIRLKFNQKVMDLIKYIIDPKNGVKDKGGYSYMALSNFLDEHAGSVTEIIPENLPTLENKPTAKNVQEGVGNLNIVGENSGTEESVGVYSAEVLPVWWKVLDFIRERMTKELFGIHILPLYPYSYEDNVLTIAAPNEYIFKEVQTKYAARLLEIIREQLGEATEMKYVKDDRCTQELIAMYEKHCTEI